MLLYSIFLHIVSVLIMCGVHRGNNIRFYCNNTELVVKVVRKELWCKNCTTEKMQLFWEL